MGKHSEQLTTEERATIMMMKANNCSAMQIALALRRAPSTITRNQGIRGTGHPAVGALVQPHPTAHADWGYPSGRS